MPCRENVGDNLTDPNSKYKSNGSLEGKEEIQPAVLLCSRLLCGLSTDTVQSLLMWLFTSFYLSGFLNLFNWAPVNYHLLILTCQGIPVLGKKKFYKSSSCSAVKLCRNLWKNCCTSDIQALSAVWHENLSWIWMSQFYLVVLTILINVVSGLQWKKWRLY